MTDQDMDSQTKTAFDGVIEYMEKLINVYTWDSCNQIRAYLMLYGKMQAAQISMLLGLEGEKSVYKPLQRLVEAGLVVKEGHRNAYYKSAWLQTLDPDFSPEFISYLLSINKYSLISEYLSAANRASIGFIQVMSDIMEKRIQSSKNSQIGSQYIDQTMFIEAMLSVKDVEPLIQKIETLIQEEFPKHSPKHSPDGAILNPTGFFLAFVPLDPL